jgi:hypothetical protein
MRMNVLACGVVALLAGCEVVPQPAPIQEPPAPQATEAPAPKPVPAQPAKSTPLNLSVRLSLDTFRQGYAAFGSLNVYLIQEGVTRRQGAGGMVSEDAKRVVFSRVRPNTRSLLVVIESVGRVRPQVVPFTTGDQDDELHIPSTRRRKATGTVLDASGAPVPGAAVCRTWRSGEAPTIEWELPQIWDNHGSGPGSVSRRSSWRSIASHGGKRLRGFDWVTFSFTNGIEIRWSVADSGGRFEAWFDGDESLTVEVFEPVSGKTAQEQLSGGRLLEKEFEFSEQFTVRLPKVEQSADSGK